MVIKSIKINNKSIASAILLILPASFLSIDTPSAILIHGLHLIEFPD